MNSLSWLLYAADVVGSLVVLLVLGGIVVLLAAVVVVVAVSNSDAPEGPIPWAAAKRLALAGGAALVLAAGLPSQRTMHAIAASELGQRAVESELGAKALKAVEKWIDSQLGGAK